MRDASTMSETSSFIRVARVSQWQRSELQPLQKSLSPLEFESVIRKHQMRNSHHTVGEYTSRRICPLKIDMPTFAVLCSRFLDLTLLGSILLNPTSLQWSPRRVKFLFLFSSKFPLITISIKHPQMSNFLQFESSFSK